MTSLVGTGNTDMKESVQTSLREDSVTTPETQTIDKTNEKTFSRESEVHNVTGKYAETLDSLQLIKDLDLFLVTAPVNWHENQVIRRYFLNKDEGFVSCVYWNNLYFITGTDIVRCIAYKMCHIGRRIVDRKKFEEGIFSDLRSLKCGTHAVLENSRSPFLKFLHRNQCLRTQKKQKVFFWFSVPHNKLFSDVLERDLKRELTNQPTTTKAVSDLYSNFKYDQSMPLMEQLAKHFSNEIGSDVSGLLLKNNELLSAVEEPEQEKPDFTEEESNLNYIPKSESNNTNNNSQFSDEFPLDFLNSATPLVDENYTTSASYTNNDARQFGGMLDSSIVENETIISPRHAHQQIYQQLQHGQPSASFSESLDGVILNSFNQPLFSASFAPQQTPSHPMYIFSGLPSAIDPKNTFGSDLNGGRNSPSQGAQFVPLHSNNIMVGPDNQFMLDQSMFANDPNSQHAPYMLQVLRSQSPSITNPNQYVSLPSSNLIPLSMAMPSATLRPSFDEAFSMNRKSTSDKTEKEYGPTNDTESTQKQSNNDQERPIEQQPDTDRHQSTEYMMLSMPSFSNNPSRSNFGVFNGQLFTPGTVGLDYNIDNAALSAGVGISPVIGFNNGLISAIQYQHSTSNRHFSTNSEDEEVKIEKKLKGMLNNENKSKVTKGPTKTKLLNPSLQHLQLDSIFDENDTSAEEADQSLNEETNNVKTEFEIE